MKCCEIFYSEQAANDYAKTINWKNAEVEVIKGKEPNDDAPVQVPYEDLLDIWIVWFNPKPYIE